MYIYIYRYKYVYVYFHAVLLLGHDHWWKQQMISMISSTWRSYRNRLKRFNPLFLGTLSCDWILQGRGQGCTCKDLASASLFLVWYDKLKVGHIFCKTRFGLSSLSRRIIWGNKVRCFDAWGAASQMLWSHEDKLSMGKAEGTCHVLIQTRKVPKNSSRFPSGHRQRCSWERLLDLQPAPRLDKSNLPSPFLIFLGIFLRKAWPPSEVCCQDHLFGLGIWTERILAPPRLWRAIYLFCQDAPDEEVLAVLKDSHLWTPPPSEINLHVYMFDCGCISCICLKSNLSVSQTNLRKAAHCCNPSTRFAGRELGLEPAGVVPSFLLEASSPEPRSNNSLSKINLSGYAWQNKLASQGQFWLTV